MQKMLFLEKCDFCYIIFVSIAFTKTPIERKVLIIEKRITPFWKEDDRAKTYLKMNKNNFFDLYPSIPLMSLNITF